jgi:hypothetical protein
VRCSKPRLVVSDAAGNQSTGGDENCVERLVLTWSSVEAMLARGQKSEHMKVISYLTFHSTKMERRKDKLYFHANKQKMFSFTREMRVRRVNLERKNLWLIKEGKRFSFRFKARRDL